MGEESYGGEAGCGGVGDKVAAYKEGVVMDGVGRGIDSGGIGDGKGGEVIEVWSDFFT